MSDTAHIALMEALAKHFFGEPNRALSKKFELRFGARGSKSVDLKKGRWYDHEAGEGGGPIDLIKRETGLTEARDCYDWAERHGYWQNGSGPGPRKDVAIYDYTNEGGELLFQKVRYEPKDFRLRRPNGRDWIYNLGNVRRVVYRLPEVIETIGTGNVIVVAEGEKDVENLWNVGVPATCNWEGAGRWGDDLTPTFADADVCIIGDNDESGRKHVNDVASKLRDVAKRVRVLDLVSVWSRCPEKGDISDWIKQTNGTAEHLYTLIEKLPDWQPKPGNRGQWIWEGEVRVEEARKWLVANLLPETGVALMSGQSGAFKTFIALDLAVAVMTGGDFIKYPVMRRGGVLLFACEGQNEVPIRIRAAYEARGGEGQAPFAWQEESPRLLDAGACAELVEMINDGAEDMQHKFGLPVVLVIIDTAGKAAGYNKAGDENDAALAKIIMRTLSAVAMQTNTLVTAVAHFGKHAETGTRGSSAYEDDADVVLAALAEKNMAGTVTNTRLSARKRRSGPNGEEYPFRTKTSDMGIDPTGIALNTLTIEWIDAAATPQPIQGKPDAWSKKSLRLLRQTLMNVLVACGKQIRPYADGPVVRAVDIEVVRPQFYKGYPAAEATDAKSKQGARQRAFHRAIKDAKTDNLISSWDIEGITYVWLITPPPTQEEELPNHKPPSKSTDSGGGAPGYDTSEGIAQRPRIGPLEIIGAEPPGTVCVHCRKNDGTVYLVRHPYQAVRSEPLHEACARQFFEEKEWQQ